MNKPIKVIKVILFNGIKVLHLPIRKYIEAQDGVVLEFIPEGVLVNKKVLLPVSNIEQIIFEKEYNVTRDNVPESKKNPTSKKTVK